MSAVKPETRCKRIARDITPLATHLKQFRPACRVISIHRNDWLLLRDAADIARANGFHVERDTVKYDGFVLQPIERGPAHPDSGPSAEGGGP